MTALDVLVAMQGACRLREARSRAPWMQQVSLDAPRDGQPRAPWEVALAAVQVMAAHGDPYPMGTASHGRCCAYAAALLAFGADATRKGNDGLSAAERAELAGHSAFAQYLSHWAGRDLDALRRTSRSLAARTPVLPATSATPSPCARAPQAGSLAMLSEAGQGSLQSLPYDSLQCICTMLAPVST